MRQKFHREDEKGFTLIELLVVMGIAVMMISIATVAYFGATKKEGVNKAKTLLRDVAMQGRQQACITGKPHALICYNDSTDTFTNAKGQTSGKPKFVLYQYVGNFYASGGNVIVPFSSQTNILQRVAKKTQFINLNDSSLRVYRFTKWNTNNNNNLNSTEVELKDGESVSWRKTSAYKIGTITPSTTWNNQPIASPVSQEFSFPKSFSYSDGAGTVIIFNSDGTVENAKSVSVTDGKNNSFTMSVEANGTVTLKDN